MDTLVPQGMPGMTPVATPKKRNWLMIVGIIIVAFIAFVGLIIGCVFSMGTPVMKSGEDFLKQLSAGQVDAAYDSTAIEFKQNVSKDVFNSFLKAYPIATKVKSVSFNSFSIEGSTGTLAGTVTGTDGQVSPVNMRMVNENNAWRVLYIDFMTPEELAAADKAAAQQQGQPANQQPVPNGTQQAVTPPANPQPISGEPAAAPSQGGQTPGTATNSPVTK